MKNTVLWVVLYACALFGQFSSGVDYSVKGSEVSGGISAGIILETGESEWEVNYGTGQRFKAASDLFSAGYSLGAEKAFGKFSAGAEIEHIFRNFTNSASGDSAGTNINFDPEDLKNSRLSAAGEIVFLSRYGLDVSAVNFSGGKESITVPGAGLNYRHNLKTGSTLSAAFKMNFYESADAPSGYYTLNTPDPNLEFKASYRRRGKNKEYGLELRYSEFDGLGGSGSSLIGAEASFSYDFGRAGSAISVLSGANLTDEFESPRIRLPFFYYSIVYSNTIIKDRLSVLAGWKHGFYYSDLRNIAGLNTVIPTEISSEEISETVGESRLYLTLVYKY